MANEEKIKIHRRDYKRIARVWFLARLYAETLTIIFIMRELAPPTIFHSAAVVVALVLLIQIPMSPLVRWLKGQYEIIDTAPIAEGDFLSHGKWYRFPKQFTIKGPAAQ